MQLDLFFYSCTVPGQGPAGQDYTLYNPPWRRLPAHKFGQVQGWGARSHRDTCLSHFARLPREDADPVPESPLGLCLRHDPARTLITCADALGAEVSRCEWPVDAPEEQLCCLKVLKWRQRHIVGLDPTVKEGVIARILARQEEPCTLVRLEMAQKLAPLPGGQNFIGIVDNKQAPSGCLCWVEGTAPREVPALAVGVLADLPQGLRAAMRAGGVEHDDKAALQRHEDLAHLRRAADEVLGAVRQLARRRPAGGGRLAPELRGRELQEAVAFQVVARGVTPRLRASASKLEGIQQVLTVRHSGVEVVRELGNVLVLDL
mmetsp:Transcript_45874/g.132864  ORF Transcript_45874/g.132864 Transcript_45874/m.132864 type:complete len:318 (-) Transcript_45874:897-1850(-)